jgi:hypothetical protein
METMMIFQVELKRENEKKRLSSLDTPSMERQKRRIHTRGGGVTPSRRNKRKEKEKYPGYWIGRTKII